MQQKLDEIEKTNTQLIAISPMLKTITASLVKKIGLTFPVLSDQGNHVAEEYGLVFTLADSVAPIYQNFGIDLPAANGDNSHKLPIPASYIVNTDRSIHYYFVDVDHTNRLDPDIMIQELKKIL